MTDFVATYPSDFHQHRAQHDPAGTCWITTERTWTWSEAWDDIRRFAGALESVGVRRGDRIAFLSPNHPAILTAMQAASLIGAADVVLDPRLAGDEIAYIVNDAQPRVLFVASHLMPVVELIQDTLISQPTVVVVGGNDDQLDAWIAAADPIERRPDVTLNDACLVNYSSGTTGRPKGVVLTQHNLMVHTDHAIGAAQLDDGDVILLATVMFHSCALFAAAAGAAGIVIEELRPELLTEALDAGLTHAIVNPTAIATLHQSGPATLARFSRLKSVTYAASPMPRTLLRTALAAWPRTRFVQVYGMTEFVGALTILDDVSHRDPDHPERQLSVGRPIPGVEMRVVDPETLVDLEPGRSGELWFRTEQATPGYLGNPEATAALVADGGWLRTGDIGRIDAAGFVYAEDRLKDIIITDGYNVYSSEVERVLTDHPAIVETAVIGVPDERWGELVKAVVVLHPGEMTSPEELLAFTRTRLASHKVPNTVDIVRSLPRTSSGKVLKRDLRKPYWAGLERQI